MDTNAAAATAAQPPAAELGVSTSNGAPSSGPSASSPATAPSLLQSMLASVQSAAPSRLHLSEGGTLKLHVLFSTPRLARELYALAHVHPTRPDGKDGWAGDAHVEAWCEKIIFAASWQPDPAPAAAAEAQGQQSADAGASSSASASSSAPRMVYALEVFLFTLPTQRSAVLYVSKLDTTGYAPRGLSSAALEKDARPFVAAALELPGAQGTAAPQPQAPTTLAKALTHAFLSYFASFAHWAAPPASGPTPAPASAHTHLIDHLSVHVLARAQHAYLFPGSPDSGGKHLLSDAQLIRWWRAVVGDVAAEVAEAGAAGASAGANGSSDSTSASTSAARVDAYYIIPGYSALESTELVPLPARATPAEQRAKWVYGHPYSGSVAYHPTLRPQGVPLPLHHAGVPPAARVPQTERRAALLAARARLAAAAAAAGSEHAESTTAALAAADGALARVAAAEHSIATLIPRFEDDPKGRFFDELVDEEGEGFVDAALRPLLRALDALPPQAAGTSSSATTNGSGASGGGSSADAHDDAAADDAQAKRRKLDDGSSAAVQSPAPSKPAAALAPEIREALVQRAALDTVSPDDFWTRMGFRQECSSGNAVGVFVVGFTRAPPAAVPSPSAAPAPAPAAPPAAGARAHAGWRPVRGSVQPALLSDLVLKFMLQDKNEWGKPAEAEALTRRWDVAVGRLLRRKGEGLNNAALASAGSSTSTSASAATSGAAPASEDDALAAFGQGVVWGSVALRGVPPAALAQAKALHAAAQAAGQGAPGARPPNKVNALAIRRKKKA